MSKPYISSLGLQEDTSLPKTKHMVRVLLLAFCNMDVSFLQFAKHFLLLSYKTKRDSEMEKAKKKILNPSSTLC
jgi:hypothetical protein